jgi:CubicO group peptidase (beta-lactamase class C family)
MITLMGGGDDSRNVLRRYSLEVFMQRYQIIRHRSHTTMLLVLLLAMAFNSAEAHPTSAAPGAPNYAAIEAHVERQMRELRLPGVALGIVQGDQIVHLKGFGVAGPDGQPVTAQTPFQFASIVKPMTGVAIMQLVESAKLDLDAPVQRYLPWFRVADVAASAQITPRHLLYHTSGLPEAVGSEYAFSGDPRRDALEQRVRELRTVQLSHSVGQTYEYSNAGYSILGLLIQTVSGQPYEAYMRRHVFEPLQMRQTFTDWAEARGHGVATGHRYWFGTPLPGQLAVDRAMLPAGGSLSGSVEDAAHFVIAQLNGGRFGDTSILSAEGIALMQRPAMPAGGVGEFHAMDWAVGPVGGETAIYKAGDMPDFKTQIVFFPERRLGLVVLMNTNRLLDSSLGDIRLPMLAYNAAELLVGQPPTSFPAGRIPTLLYTAIMVAVVVQAIGMARTVLLLRRWRDRLAQCPLGRGAVMLRLWLPLFLNLGWSLLTLVGVPALFGGPFSYGLYVAPDLFSMLLVSGTVALVWGVVRSLLLWGLPRARQAFATTGARLVVNE